MHAAQAPTACNRAQREQAVRSLWRDLLNVLFAHQLPPMHPNDYEHSAHKAVRCLAPVPTDNLLQSAVAHELCALLLGKHRSEEHTSELQSRFDLVCRLLLEKK